MAFGNALIPATMAAAVGSVTVDLGGNWERVFLSIPSMVSASALDVYVAVTTDQTYYQLRKEIPNTTTVQCWSFVVSAIANGAVVPLPAGFRYMKLIATDSAPAAAIGFKIMCDSNS